MSEVTVLFKRSDGKELAFDDFPFGVTALEGVDGPKLEIFSEKKAQGDGDIITGKRVDGRLITISAKNRNVGLNRQMRKIASAFFNPLYTFDVEVNYQGSTRTAYGCELKAIAMPTENVYRRLKITLTMHSPTGYLGGGGLHGLDINSIRPRLGWPWVSVANVGMLFSLRSFAKVIAVNNDGDAPTYIKAEFIATGTDAVKNPSLIKGESHIKVLTELQPGQVLEIDTEKKQVKIDGTSALNLVDKTSNWAGMRMDAGQNSFGFDADSNDNQLAVRIYYTNRFYGIGG